MIGLCVDSQEQLEQLFSTLQNKSEDGIVSLVKLYLRIRNRNSLFPKNLFDVYSEQLFKNVQDKKCSRMFKDVLDYSFMKVGPIQFLSKMKECYFRGNYFSGRTGITYFTLFEQAVAKTKLKFLPLLPLVGLLRGFGYLHSTADVKNRLAEFCSFLQLRDQNQDEETDCVVKILAQEFDLMRIQPGEFKNKISQIPFESYSAEVQGELIQFVESESLSNCIHQVQNLDKELRAALSQKPDQKIFEAISCVLLSNLKFEVAQKVSSEVLEFLTGVVAKSNKNLSKQALQLLVLFVECSQ